MNICPNCDHELVNIIYGFPSERLIHMAKNEDLALGGCSLNENSPTHYCYGCNETFFKKSISKSIFSNEIYR